MLRPWDFSLSREIDPRSETPIYLQVVHALIQDIRRGRLLPGTILPSTRAMAEALGVNRKTIVLAYDDLIAQGWLETSGTRGTFVSDRLPEPVSLKARGEADAGPSRSPDFSFRAVPPPQIVYRESSCVTFDDGVPDHRLLVTSSLASAYRTALQSATRIGGMTYGDPMGSNELRQLIAEMLSTHRGMVTTPENICITRGSQMGIFLASRVLLSPGDVVLVEGLSYAPAREAFKAAGADVIGVRIDKDGLDVEEVEQLCLRRRVRVVYVTPHHQFPTTVSLKGDRRSRLLDLAGRFGFAVLEDDYDHEFHYQSQPLLPMASYAPHRTIYIGSTSKLLLPGLRVGYLAGPRDFVRSIANEAAVVDRQGNTVTELAVADLIKSGELRRHARKALQIYRTRREAFASSLQNAFGDAIEFEAPDGGLAFWVKFRDQAVLDEIEEKGASCGVKFLPSRCFATPPHCDRGLRLGFGSFGQGEAEEAIRKLRALADR
ncbi:PLP-dependent aminotransferase family protein [Methylocystis heyeri]|uniref:Aminotransferase class I/II-fold pyridoxal phosphate-dependent enzyme n=1 Tax=Methylocystis heyeri TaxID=391905 RepID=A0A6B8KBU1_9HYPH|nr:PLP-dependent aminotransferase family protein [Methylocystis heyeri]QGM45864.1 aminotransferase class I/II-fold pyridoxal phosphate-dependent enzyme [Methylocystis heyeri]